MRGVNQSKQLPDPVNIDEFLGGYTPPSSSTASSSEGSSFWDTVGNILNTAGSVLSGADTVMGWFGNDPDQGQLIAAQQAAEAQRAKTLNTILIVAAIAVVGVIAFVVIKKMRG